MPKFKTILRSIKFPFRKFYENLSEKEKIFLRFNNTIFRGKIKDFLIGHSGDMQLNILIGDNILSITTDKFGRFSDNKKEVNSNA